MKPMTEHSTPWTNTTHDWAVAVDRNHLDAIRKAPDTYAPGGLSHLVLEVLAYANDEAEALGRRGQALVTVHADGSVSIADDGRGTDTRRDANGRVIKKPIMATKDLRFFDPEHDVLLPDGAPRRGISVVAALSQWLTHTNRRQNGAWTQRYEHGLPTTDLVPIDSENGTGTTVHFLADHDLVAQTQTMSDAFLRDVESFPWLSVVAQVE
jgi:topoisomerase-4 subunit B